VHRWLVEARKTGMLTEDVAYRFNPQGLSDEQRALVADVQTWRTLLERLHRVLAPNNVSVRSVRVFPSGEGETELRLWKFGLQAAGALAEAIRRSSTVALAWGTTIARVIDALGARGTDSLDRHVEFVPVRAQEPGEPRHGTSSSMLAERLDEIVNGPGPWDGAGARRKPLTLNGVPAFTPSWFREDVRFREYLHRYKVFHTIFGLTEQDRRLGTRTPAAGEPVIKRVDTLFTSIGTRDKPVGDFYEQLRLHGNITAAELTRIVLGDIGGVLIPAPHCSKGDLHRVAALNEIFTGLQREHLEEIAARAHRDGKPGVIVASVGDKAGARARTLLGVISAGLVNEIVVDRQLAESLLSLLKEPEAAGDASAAAGPARRRRRAAR
jgi:DNA-binding transcriptional regulator LsrR (DeoR family)